jgi:hypothetical protein
VEPSLEVADMSRKSTTVFTCHSTIDRADIRGPMSRHKEFIGWAFENGYDLVRSGPERVDAMHVDPDQFHIIAEKVIK